MSINLFIIESMGVGSTHSIRPETFRFQVNAHLVESGLSCNSKSCVPRTAAEVAAAFREFSVWGQGLPKGELVLLVISLHGLPPVCGHMATAGISASHTNTVQDVVNWHEVMRGVIWPRNTVVLVDSCWGGTPTFVSRASGQLRPRLVFGPTRMATAVEMGLVRFLLVALIAKYGTVHGRHVRRLVDSVNRLFRPNKEKAPFFRVWAQGLKVRHRFVRYPDTMRRIRRSSV